MPKQKASSKPNAVFPQVIAMIFPSAANLSMYGFPLDFLPSKG